MKAFLIGLLFLFSGGPQEGKAQEVDSCRTLLANGLNLKWEAMGKTKIYLKDGTIKVRCTIREVRKLFVLYEKDGALHDLLIERIDHLEVPDQKFLIYFNNEKRPIIRYYSGND